MPRRAGLPKLQRQPEAIDCARLAPRVPSPACGRGWRADASRARALRFAPPLSPLAFARDPLPALRGEGTRSQQRAARERAAPLRHHVLDFRKALVSKPRAELRIIRQELVQLAGEKQHQVLL